MNRFFRQFGLFCFGVLLASVVVNAGAIKTWTNEVLTYTDLNSNFDHIHNNMVGGHGARLVNADVSTSAAIAHSKLATPALVPKIIGYVAPSCTASPCTVAMNSGVTSITRSGTGLYRVTLSSARANTTYGVLITPMATDVSVTSLYCTGSVISTSTFDIGCRNSAAAYTDAGFTISLLDNDN